MDVIGPNKAFLVSDSCRVTERNGNSISTEVMNTPLKSIKILLVSHKAQDFAQILYFVGGVCIINRNNVFHSFPDWEITCLPCFFVYYCQHAKLNISSYENTNKTQPLLQNKESGQNPAHYTTLNTVVYREVQYR
jgi:hypothetical protein